MPEGDTVWLTARRLDTALSATTLTRAELRVPQLATVELTGDQVTTVLARGKHLLIRLGSARTVHSHLRMDGAWRLHRTASAPRPGHGVRILLGNDSWLATGHPVHDLAVVPTDQEDRLVGHLGPDLLGPDWDAAEAVWRLRAAARRPIGEALLDQRLVAGIGNLYKSETLFSCGVFPWAAAGDLDLERLLATARRLMLSNREHPEQSTTGLLRRGAQHWVYRRAGLRCRRCGTII